MAWEIAVFRSINPPAAQWIDRPKATGWLREARRLARLPVPPTWDGRKELVRQMGTAFGQFIRAIDMPAPSVAPYARRMIEANPGPSPLDTLGRPEQGTTAETVPEMLGLGTGTWEPMLRAEVRRYSGEYREMIDGGGDAWLDMVERQYLEIDGRWIVRPDNVLADPDHGVDFARASQPNDNGWNAVGWKEWWPSTYSPSRVGEIVAHVPLRWTYDLLRGAIEECATLGVDGTILASRLWIIRKNLVTARAVGVAVPVDVIQLAADAEEEANDGLGALERGGLDLGAGILAAFATQPGGVILAAFAGLAVAFAELLFLVGGRATVTWRDTWGREEPLLEQAYISGVILEREQIAPTQLVMDPPAPPTGLIIQLTPETVAQAMKASRENPRVSSEGSRGASKGAEAIGLAALAALLLR